MKILAAPKLLVQLVFAFSTFALVSDLWGQGVGTSNPSGVSGIFNGNITTGCSYDPYTGNAMRVITDIVVAGAVGEYPMALSRTSNSRNSWIGGFGWAGGWHHNYEWVMEPSGYLPYSYSPPAAYTVDFPDGRRETFQYVTWDTVDYRVWGTGGVTSSAGVRERVQPLNGSTVYLVLPDGGKVQFTATQNYQSQLGYYYTYVAHAIIDRYGLSTTFSYNVDGTLNTITETAGRWLQLTWGTPGGGTKVITKVTGSDGRFNNYYYYYSPIGNASTPYTYLDHVGYFSYPASWAAYYTYQTPNVGSVNGAPLLLTCDDPIYQGPMRSLAYTYRTATNPDGTTPAPGQVQSENYYNTNTHAIGSPVSTLIVGAAGNSNVRTEMRGDGSRPTRTFNYSTSGYLLNCTDFMGVSASQTYDPNTNYINSVTDRNGKITNFTSNALTGLMTQVQYPLTTEDTPGQSVRPTVNYTYGNPNCADANNRDANNPYYVCTATDEGGHVTQFTRDANKRVTRIDYPAPDGGYETFSYSGNNFGEVTSHYMRTGGTEKFTYDTTNGRKLTYCDPYHANGNPPSAWYQYEGHGWLSGVTDALGNGSGDANHTTNYDYNLRGQVWRTTFPPPVLNGARRTIVNAYNPNGDGTIVTVTNQLGQPTNYTSMITGA